MMYKGFRVRIYPNEKQSEVLKEQCYYNHKLWNFLVGKYINDADGPRVGKFNIINYTVLDLKRDFIELYPEASKVHTRVFLSVMMKYCETWKRCYKKIGRSPKFHSYDPNKQSFSIGSITLNLSKYKIKLPKSRSYKEKIENSIPVSEKFLTKFNISEVINPTFTNIRGIWYLSGTYKISIDINNKSNDVLGLDWGIKNFYTLSNDTRLNYPKSVYRCYERIKKLTSILSKKVKNSNNYNKLKLKINKAWERFNNIKKDFIEQETCKLSKFNIVVEDLTKAKILKSHKNRRCLQLLNPRDRFNIRLQQKCILNDNSFILVNPYNTSKTCSCCGNIITMKLSDREFNCDSCGLVIDRDLNASINIRQSGIKLMQGVTVNP